MNRTERVVAALVLVVNLSIGFALVSRSDYSELVDEPSAAAAMTAALSPEAERAPATTP